jgi:hypothetical protein
MRRFADCCECGAEHELSAETIEIVERQLAEGKWCITGFLCDECSKAHDDEQKQ